MQLNLIRHAVTAETGVTLSGRIAGIPLSEEGREMAGRAARALDDVRPSALFTSPIERCRETASILGAGWGLKPTVDRGFIEADYGAWSGRKLASLYRLKAWGRLMGSASRFRFPDGETLEEVQRRAVAATERIAAASRKDATVVVVSHADVIRALLAHYLGMPLDLIHRLDVRPASLSVVHLVADQPPRVAVVNQRVPSR
jgi:probable phosphoglycerate mutase